MKKGCFISVIGLFTLIVIAGFYIIKYYGNDILEAGKDKVMDLTLVKIDDELSNLVSDENTDSLKLLMSNFVMDVKKMEIEKGLEKIEDVIKNLEIVVKDNKIDSLELNFLKKLVRAK